MIGGVCAAGVAIIVVLIVIIIIGLVLLWRRKSDALTLTIQGEQRCASQTHYTHVYIQCWE